MKQLNEIIKNETDQKKFSIFLLYALKHYNAFQVSTL